MNKSIGNKVKGKIAVILFLFLLLMIQDKAMGIDSIRVPLIKNPPVMDGKLDDEAWAKLPWLNDFTVFNAPDKPAQVQSRFKICHDNKNIYFGIYFDEPKTNEIKAACAEKDGKVFIDDSAEIFIDPGRSKLEYYHIVINSRGVVYDAFCIQGGLFEMPVWDGDIKTSARVYADHWIIEAAIPLYRLGLSSSAKGSWGINVTRNRQDASDLSSFAPITASFAQPSMFREMILDNSDLSRYLWQITKAEDKVVSIDGKITYQTMLFVANQTEKFRLAKIDATLISPSGKKSVCSAIKGINKNKESKIEIRMPIEEQGQNLLCLLITDQEETAKDPLFAKQFSMTLNYMPIEIALLSPAYKDCIFATQDISEIEMELFINLAKTELQGKDLLAQLCSLDKQKIFSKQEVKGINTEKVKLNLPAKDLDYGDYLIVVTLLDKKEKLYGAEKRLRKLRPLKGEVRFDKNLTTLVDGKPFLPVGWYHVTKPEDLARVSREGTTVVYTYGGPSILDECAKNNLKVIWSPYPPALDKIRHGHIKHLLTSEEAKQIKDYVNTVKTHPAILAWLLSDEPEVIPSVPESLKAIYAAIDEVDPYHPCLITDNSVSSVATYNKYADLLMPDPYPGCPVGSYGVVRKTSEYVAAAKATGKPTWVTMQAFSWGDYKRNNCRIPDFVELRNQLYQALVQGAKGFTWFAYHKGFPYPSIRIGVPYLAREIAALKNGILLAQEIPEEITIQPQTPDISCSFRKTGEKIYLFTVSMSDKPVNLDFLIKDKRNGKLAVVSEGRMVAVVDGKFSEHFEPYEAHVYTDEQNLPALKNIAEIKEEIRLAEDQKKEIVPEKK